jgi:hypothetical protein
MPRRATKVVTNCAICLGHNRDQDDPFELCDAHSKVIYKKFSDLLTAFEGDFEEMVVTLLHLGSKFNKISPNDLGEILVDRLNWTLPNLSRESKSARFNSTQALKRYCREKYKENPSKMKNKPPKNSCSKNEFMNWAISNKIDLSAFKTRAYRKRNVNNNQEDSTSGDKEFSESIEMDSEDDSEPEESSDHEVKESPDAAGTANSESGSMSEAEQAVIQALTAMDGQA